MGRWSDHARAQALFTAPVPNVPKAPKCPSKDEFGTTGTIGTASLDEIEERIAIAVVEGGIPPPYAQAFAKLQLTPPSGLSADDWRRAVDDAGCFLDQHGPSAVALGWTPEDLFAPEGLIRALSGARVVALMRGETGAMAARLSDGRTVRRWN